MKQKSDLGSRERTGDITPEEVRSLDPFKDWDVREIEELIAIIKVFISILYNNVSKNIIREKPPV